MTSVSRAGTETERSLSGSEVLEHVITDALLEGVSIYTSTKHTGRQGVRKERKGNDQQKKSSKTRCLRCSK